MTAAEQLPGLSLPEPRTIPCLSLTQPWATLVATGKKRIETRGWQTAYRGPLAIHAARVMPFDAVLFTYRAECWPALVEAGMAPAGLGDRADALPRLPRGVVIAVCRLTHVGAIYHLPDEVRVKGVEWTVQPREVAFGNYRAGRYAWVLSDIRALPEPSKR